MSGETIKHLEFIQSVISRMNDCSFKIKGWAVTVTSALLALYAYNNIKICLYTSIVAITAFCLLDAYYLQQERKFCGMYDDVAGISNDNNLRPFEMKTTFYKKGKYRYCKALFSKTIMPLYLSLVVAVIILGKLIK